MDNSSLLSKQIEQAIKEEIIAGDLEAGHKISIAELRKKWGTSSTPIRDAVKSLEGKGFLIVLPRESITVTTMDRETFREVFDLRIALECMAVELATPLIPIEKIDETINIYRNAAKKFELNHDIECLNRVDFFVHELVFAFCNNKRLVHMNHEISDLTEWARRIVINQPHSMEFALPEHLHILNAIRRRSVVDAQEAMRIHLKNAFRRTVEVL